MALLRAPGIGPVRFARLIEHFGSAAAAFAASRAELDTLELPNPALNYLAAPDWRPVEQDLAWLAQSGNHHLLSFDDPRYPLLLRHIAYPPPLLFVSGDPDCLRAPQLAIVGSRNPTPLGRETAHLFAAHLAGAGMVVTSGLAFGIDAAAHQGALSSGGLTIAVMGTGLDRVYPAKHRELAHAIVERGALVSELPAGTVVTAENFPRRNRLISGLALGVLVVEAAIRSGSLITARLANEQGREVFAIPGSIHNPMAKGCHALIRQGAKLVETAADILEELGSLAAAGSAVSAPTAVAPSAVDALDNDYRQLLAAIGSESAGIDDLVDRCGLTVEAVSSMLLIMELEGYVAAVPGGLYCRIKL
ncbi:MAG: DNA-processing protein DprA [Candidatus Competibacteraceae bacterium]